MANEIPDPKIVPNRVNPNPGLSILSDEELDKYCGDAGLTLLKAKTVRAFNKIGEHLNAVGVIHVGTAKVVETSERIDRLINRCEQIIDENEDPDVKVNAVKAERELLSEQLRAQELIVKMAEKKLVRDPNEKQRAKSFQIGAAVSIQTAGDVRVGEAKDFAPQEPTGGE